MKILSIIVPAYNTEKYLSQCLDSITISDYLNSMCEIIVVNDGSKDNTSKIAHDYATKFNNIKVIDKENGGHGSGINTGVRVATGKYFKVIDSDDWVLTENLISFIKKLMYEDRDVVAHYQRNIYEDIGKIEDKTIEFVELEKEYLIENIPNNTLLGLSNICYKTSIYKKNEILIDEKCFYVDFEYILFPLKHMKNFIVYDDIVYCYRLGNPIQSINYTSMYINRQQHYRVIERLLSFYDSLNEENINNNFIKYVETIISNLVKAHYYIYFMNDLNREDIYKLILFDKTIKKYKKIYIKTSSSKSINFMRMIHFRCFAIMTKLYRKMIGNKENE